MNNEYAWGVFIDTQKKRIIKGPITDSLCCRLE